MENGLMQIIGIHLGFKLLHAMLAVYVVQCVERCNMPSLRFRQ